MSNRRYSRAGRLAFAVALIATVGIVSGCATSDPSPQARSMSADPSASIASLESRFEQAGSDRVDLLAPVSFANAERALEEAKRLRSEGKSGRDILTAVERAESLMSQAEEHSRISRAALQLAVEKRDAAMAAGARRYFPENFREADRDFLKMTRAIEKGDTRPAREKRAELAVRYDDLELRSIREKYLGQTTSILKNARGEGASKWAPRTLAKVEERLTALDAAIQANRHNESELRPASDDLRTEAEFLLQATRQSKLARSEDPEEMVLRMEEQRKQLAELSQQKLERERALTERQRTVSELEEQKQFNEKFKEAAALFDPNEAEVFRTGEDRLLIRLKGLGFPVKGAEIPSESFALLNKVKQVLGRFREGSTVVLEGHTDAVGRPELNRVLSEDRADAVKDYLVAEGAVSEAQVTIQGKGDQIPIASNKTRAGRALNRRVDVIIDAGSSG